MTAEAGSPTAVNEYHAGVHEVPVPACTGHSTCGGGLPLTAGECAAEAKAKYQDDAMAAFVLKFKCKPNK